jgi:Family of unknown function (DUF5678)
MSEKTLPSVRPASLPHIDRAHELQWLSQHGAQYAGQWVVLDGNRLLGAGSNPEPLLKQANASGCARPLVVHVPTNGEPFTGGWL